MAQRVAVIDIGSNSVRMVVYEKTSRFAFRILHEEKSRVRISENAYQNGGVLQDEAMQRTIYALENFLTIISSFKARKTLCIATSALRDAPNKKDFLHNARHNLGLKIKIIDGQREAYLGAIACANLLPDQDRALSIDIGGGSTEFSIISKKNIDNNISLNLGTVRLKELFFDNNDINGAKELIDLQLKQLDNIEISTIIGIGGTFRAISLALMNNNKYPMKKLHAYESSYSEFRKFLTKVLESNETGLKKLGIKSARFDVIKPGALILDRVLNKFKVDNLTTSGVGLREGVYLADLLRNSKDKFPINYNTSVRQILDSHVDDTAYSNQLSKLSKQLFDITYEELGIDIKYRYELAIAAKLCMSGSSMHFYSQYRHSYYLLQNALEFGFTHKQIMLISTLAKYAKKRFPSSLHVEKYKGLLPNNNELNALSYILSLSIALLSHKPRNIDLKLEFSNGELIVESKNSLYLAKENIKKLNPLKNFNIIFSS
ncbi:Ppx/GppA family phosphatase [Candidatus Sulfurimonas marisnigri]|uniref:Ppx/GppA family phosphatase n=1 Tax=Candidatus Sulfurimonas marisnigri TaxID=2740405 RepID=A0A7S7M2K6_9BACT|nr:Ppx/GppA phosphatase family protein [Candidatus Sulfurimonas marisnigri]QOY55398.1 Ppx/GppA family phosphatase [Candidatus Sulfurimonas marisnigri]